MHIHYLGKKINNPLAVTIGNFDGVHIGHQFILSKLNDFAVKNNMNSAVISFFPHPRKVLYPRELGEVLYIDTLRQKIIKLLNYADNLLLLKFTKNLSKLSAQDFVKNLSQLNVKYIIVADDFYFGNKRSADSKDLQVIAQDYAIKVDIIHTLNTKTNSDDIKDKISSTLIRESLKQADFVKFKQYTNTDFYYTNKVSKGKQIGRTIGFPTINLRVNKNFILPSGIYAVYVDFLDENFLTNKLKGVASLGYRPTVELDGNSNLLLEVYILNWSGDAYKKRVKVTFLQKIRDEQFFENLDELKYAIHADIKKANDIY